VTPVVRFDAMGAPNGMLFDLSDGGDGTMPPVVVVDGARSVVEDGTNDVAVVTRCAALHKTC
jgi:hypothetical protein